MKDRATGRLTSTVEPGRSRTGNSAWGGGRGAGAVTALSEWRVAVGNPWVWQSISTVFGVQVHGYVICVA